MTPDFTGFPPEALTFLRGLKANNDRAWFAEQKKTYEKALKVPAAAFADALVEALAPIAGGPVKAKVFRINRDIRFSKDKSPYNVHLHIGLSLADDPQGPGYYFGLEPDRLVIGGGSFEESGASLDALRRAIDLDGDHLAKLVKGWRLHPPALKRVPAPYAQDHPHADLLKHKGVSIWRDEPPQRISLGAGLVDHVTETFAGVAPLIAWLQDAKA